MRELARAPARSKTAQADGEPQAKRLIKGAAPGRGAQKYIKTIIGAASFNDAAPKCFISD